MYLNMLLLWTGTSISWWSGQVTPIMIHQLMYGEDKYEESEMESMALRALIQFGVGNVFGSIYSGLKIDQMGSKNYATRLIAIIIMCILITFISILWNKYNVISFLMCFAWGFQDGSLNIYLNQLLGFEFENSSEPFAVYNLLQGLSVFFFQVIQGKINGLHHSIRPTYLLLYTLLCGVFGVTAAMITIFFPYLEKN